MPERTSHMSAYLGAFVSLVSSLTLTDIGILVGILTAAGTYIYNRQHMINKEKREARQAELDEQIKLLQIARLKGTVDA